ncbi:MAG: Scr1 family TA system antitoxin-like transcriptional regulator [Pseudonocardiaceae bacterium]
MERQQILYKGNHRFHFILAQQALLTIVGDTQVALGQLDRLLNFLPLPRVRLGIISATANYQVPTNQFRNGRDLSVRPTADVASDRIG